MSPKMERLFNRVLPVVMVVLGLILMGWGLMITPDEVRIKQEVLYLDS